jgi:hypothetical protein
MYPWVAAAFSLPFIGVGVAFMPVVHQESGMRKSGLLLAALVALAPLCAGGGSDEATLKRMMTSDLTGIKGVFESRYAPKSWKERHLQWDLETEFEIAKWRINALDRPNVKQYQTILKDFVQSTRDYHVQIGFWSTEQAKLPFSIAEAEGRYFISHIWYYKLPEEGFPFQAGDELVEFDGKPAAEAVAEVQHLMVANHVPTDRSLACIFLTERLGMLLPNEGAIPRGPITVGIRPQGSDEVIYRQLVWEYTPEEISPDTPRVRNKTSDNFWQRIHKTPSGVLREQMMVDPTWGLRAMGLAQKSYDGAPMGDEYEPIGHRKTLLPPLGEVIWEYTPTLPEIDLDEFEDDTVVRVPWLLNFNAYIYLTPSGKKVGFVRIPDYAGDSLEAFMFGDIMAHMEEEADLLIIDQMNNPGGSVFYTYALLSHLSNQPLKTPRHVTTITQQDVLEAKMMLPLLEQISSDREAREMLGPDLGGYAVDYNVSQMMIEYLRFIGDEWNAGRWKTRPYYLFAVDQINPAREGVFTKPIIVLVNELDLSAGDFFPAILQDNGRALIVGTRTAGAGGYVTGHMYPNIFGVALVTYTGSIAWRPEQLQPIENLGVQPDRLLPRTVGDMQQGYVDYAQALNAIVEEVLAE